MLNNVFKGSMAHKFARAQNHHEISAADGSWQ